jgi:hypothetical protein
MFGLLCSRKISKRCYLRSIVLAYMVVVQQTLSVSNENVLSVDSSHNCFQFQSDCIINNPARVIWMYWAQGEDDLKQNHVYNYLCVSAWRSMNPTWRFVFLDLQNRQRFVPEIKYYSLLEVQKQADILRLMLLIKYGGVWVDASVLPMRPLDTFIDTYVNNDGSLFMYKYTNNKFPDLLISNWFMYTPCASHPMLSEWLLKIIYNLHDVEKTRHYYATHHALGQLYNYGNKLTKCVLDSLVMDAIPPHNIPHDISFSCESTYHYEAMYKRANYTSTHFSRFDEFRSKYVTYLRTCFDSSWFVDDWSESLMPPGQSLLIPVELGDITVYYKHHFDGSSSSGWNEETERKVNHFCQSVCHTFEVSDEACSDLVSLMLRDIANPRDPDTTVTIGG